MIREKLLFKVPIPKNKAGTKVQYVEFLTDRGFVGLVKVLGEWSTTIGNILTQCK